MALTFVGSASNSAIDGGNVTVTLPSMQEGDVVYAIGGAGDFGVDIGISTAGYTTLGTHLGDRFTAILARKVMGATPDASITFSGSGVSLDGIAGAVHVWRGADTTTPEDATPVEVTSLSGVPDSGSITTSTDGAEVLTLFAELIFDTTVTAPTGYGNQEDAAASDTNDITVGIASKNVASAGAEDPGAWAAVAQDEFVAYTVAIKPAAGAPTGTSTSLIEAPSISATATHPHTGTASAAIEAPSLAATGQHGVPATGTATALIEAPSLAATARENATGQATAAVDAPGIDATGAQGMTGTAALGVDAPGVDAEGAHATPSGTAILTIDALTLDATGKLRLSGQASAEIAAPLLSATGTAVAPPLTGLATFLVATPTLAATVVMQPTGIAAFLIDAPLLGPGFGISVKLDITDTDILQLPVNYQLSGQPPPIPGALTAEGETRVTAKVKMRSGGRLSGGKSSFTVRTDSRGYD